MVRKLAYLKLLHSAQVTVNYTIESLINRPIVGFVNLAEKNVAGFLSQFLLLGFSDENGTTCLINWDRSKYSKRPEIKLRAYYFPRDTPLFLV